jgi:hypothetical protein
LERGRHGRGLIVDDKVRVIAAHGLSLVPARQHRLTLQGRRLAALIKANDGEYKHFAAREHGEASLV